MTAVSHRWNSPTSFLLSEMPLVKAAPYKSGRSLEVRLSLVRADDRISLLSESENRLSSIPSNSQPFKKNASA